MKSRIFLYLFLFAFLFVVFQYANSKRYFEAKEKEIHKLEERIAHLQVELLEAEQAADTKADGFSLKTNNNAREYFEDQSIAVDSLIGEIESEIISKNSATQDNPYAPYASAGDQVMRINRIKVLNNRWIMAEFTDGSRWGEVWITYFIDENQQLQFDVEDGVIYAE